MRRLAHYGRDNSLGRWERILKGALIVVGVRDPERVLVAIGFLSGTPEIYGGLHDFVVDPDHQKQGLAECMNNMARKIAVEEYNIPYFYADLKSGDRTAPLAGYYRRTGYNSDNYGVMHLDLRKNTGRNPQALQVDTSSML